MKREYSEAEIKKANEFVEKFAFSKKDHLYSDVKSGLTCGAVFAWILQNFRLREEDIKNEHKNL